MTRSAGSLAALALLVAVTGCSGGPPPRAERSASRPGFGGDFTLTSHEGKPFRLSDVRGRPAFLFFGYTSCPDMCPVTMSRITGALSRVGKSAAEVVTLFITVDPRRDSPAVLKEYVESFSTRVIGLTGSADEIRQVATAYRASYEFVPTGTPNYLVNHTSAIFLIDRQGALRQYFKFDENPDTLAAALEAVLDERK